LTLLAAVRGLESLEGPTTVTLLSNNRYLIRSLSKSLPRWRQNNFRWEHFGRRIEVQHAELWRRIDRALGIHRVQACLISTCLVSHGPHAPAANEGKPAKARDPQTTRRLDRGHVPANTHGTPGGSDSPSRVVPAPSRRLRRLLAADAAANGDATPNGDAAPSVEANAGGSAPVEGKRRRRGRFTAEDLRTS
jgi:ribonuclease HI